MCGNERSGPIAPGHTSALRIIICTPFSRFTVCVIRKFSANEHSIYASAHEISARLDQRDHPAQRNFHTNIQIGVHAHCDKTGWRLSLGVGHIQIPANGQAEPALMLDDWPRVPLRSFPKKRKKPPGFQLGDSHISEPPSVGEGFEVLEPVAEGDWAGRFGFWVAIPSTELGNDPRGPSKCFRRVGNDLLKRQV